MAATWAAVSSGNEIYALECGGTTEFNTGRFKTMTPSISHGLILWCCEPLPKGSFTFFSRHDKWQTIDFPPLTYSLGITRLLGFL